MSMDHYGSGVDCLLLRNTCCGRPRPLAISHRVSRSGHAGHPMEGLRLSRIEMWVAGYLQGTEDLAHQAACQKKRGLKYRISRCELMGNSGYGTWRRQPPPRGDGCPALDSPHRNRGHWPCQPKTATDQAWGLSLPKKGFQSPGDPT